MGLRALPANQRRRAWESLSDACCCLLLVPGLVDGNDDVDEDVRVLIGSGNSLWEVSMCDDVEGNLFYPGAHVKVLWVDLFDARAMTGEFGDGGRRYTGVSGVVE